jgi:Holliday junction DNA helicase RuvA
MITQLSGPLVHLNPDGPTVEIDTGGVVYEVLVPLALWPEIQALAGESDLTDADTRPPITLHIYYYATANQPVPVLVGFLRRAEREFFRKFTSVEGIGPTKAAKALNISISTVARAIEQEDRAVLTRLPGIGPRAADKIIASLRGKVAAEASMQDGALDEPLSSARIEQQRLELDAIDAIMALGYSRAEARRWVEDVRAQQPDLERVEDITLAVLRGRDSS